MTRINSDINPKMLKRLHLIAELREITMVPAALRRSLKTNTTENIKKRIPNKFTLNKGHVTFFYDKMQFLQNRFEKLCVEMENRGYSVDRNRSQAFDDFEDVWCNDWKSTKEDDNIVIERINFRISQKPHLYEDSLPQT